MRADVKLSSNREILPFRTRYRQEMNCQIVHDSIHRREGWTLSYLLGLNGLPVGFGSIAIAGPWKEKPTVFEFYVLPEHRPRGFDLFEAFLAASGARFFEAQSNDTLFTVLVHTYGCNLSSEKIVFHDAVTTAHQANGAALRRLTPEEKIQECIEWRQGGGEWALELHGQLVGNGGMLFHYNRPYGDIYMEVIEEFRRRGFGSYLVQELKRECRERGVIPCARCDPANTASRRTLLAAGFSPFAHILIGSTGPDQDSDPLPDAVSFGGNEKPCPFRAPSGRGRLSDVGADITGW
jgi:GNAT superfamily N-acetyltransferase